MLCMLSQKIRRKLSVTTVRWGGRGRKWKLNYEEQNRLFSLEWRPPLCPFAEWVASKAQLITQPRRTIAEIMCDFRFEDDEDIKIIKRYCRVLFELNFFSRLIISIWGEFREKNVAMSAPAPKGGRPTNKLNPKGKRATVNVIMRYN